MTAQQTAQKLMLWLINNKKSLSSERATIVREACTALIHIGKGHRSVKEARPRLMKFVETFGS